MAKRTPAIRVSHLKSAVSKVEWQPADGNGTVDITHWRVTHVERQIDPIGIPLVTLTIIARLVEVDEEG